MSSNRPQEKRRRHLLALLPYLGHYRGQLAVGALMVLLTNLAAVTAPWILRAAIDDLTIEVARAKLLFYAGLILGISLVEGSFRFLMRRVLIGVSRRIEFDLRNDLFAHLQTLPPSFYVHRSTGDLMARSTNDLSAVRSVLGPGIMYSLNTIFTAILAVGILLRLNLELAVAVLLPLLLVTLCVRYFGKRIHARFERIQEQFSRLTEQAQEAIAGVRVLRAYVQEDASIEEFRKVNQVYMAKSLQLVKLWGVFNPLLTLFLGICTVVLLWLGGSRVMSGALTIGELVAFVAYVGMLTWPTIALGWVINVMERGAASMGRINELLETTPEIQDSPEAISGAGAGHILVQDLTFSYNGSPVLENISFEVQPGETVAIVGRTGSGKTTLAQLLCRFYPVEDNTILFDGIDINSITLHSLRSAIGYVPQETFLFSETVASNIAFGRPDAGPQEIREAARSSHFLPEVAALPKGLDTRVGERGVTLSGGQKQRVAISRALLVRPQILILDDSLSNVDTHTEEEILKHLAREWVGRTAILISHRISTIREADQILVLDEGKIIERGGHEALLKQGGMYASLYQKQLLREQLGLTSP